MNRWNTLPLAERIRLLRWTLPPTLILVVVLYQLGPARYVQNQFGHLTHYSVEIAFYSLVGPIVTWVTLVWIGRWLADKEAAEQHARERERYLASITAASADAIISLDTEWHIRSWNHGAESIFGYTTEDIIGKPFRALLADQERAPGEIACLSTGLNQTGVVRDYELICTTRSGRRVIVELTQTQLTGDTGRILGTSVVLRNVTKRREAEEIVNEERARIARDLHDGVAQTLYFLALKTDVCRNLLDQDRDQVRTELTTIKQNLQDAIQDVRSTIFALRPLDLRRLGFWRGTRQFITAFGEQHGLDIDLQVAGDRHNLASSVEPTVFRLIQESLNNVGKHAGARHVWITLGLGNPEVVQLTIRDDGEGFEIENGMDSSSGLGLTQMRERVEALDGTFRVTSRITEGTTVLATLPIEG